MTWGPEWREQMKENLDHLQGETFLKARFNPSEDGDHDHCQGCWAAISDAIGPDIFREAYRTVVPDTFSASDETGTDDIVDSSYIAANTEQARISLWVCPVCFMEFKDEWGFLLFDADSAPTGRDNQSPGQRLG